MAEVTAWSKPELAGRVAGDWLRDKPLRLVTKPCSCGGEITADRDDPGEMVRRHNATAQHLRSCARSDCACLEAS